MRLFILLIALFISTSLFAEVEDIQPSKLTSRIEQGAALIDVRTPEEYDKGHVPGAINIPLSEFSESNAELMAIAEKEIILYCRSGFRAGKAANKLLQMSFEKVKHLDGDMLGWEAAGLPVEKN